MTRLLNGSALALPLLLCAAPALADTPASADIIALGHRADAHGPSGTMEDHVHKSGDLMIGLSWMHEDYRGTNQRGGDEISDTAIAAAGFTSRTKAMTMDMAMLHVMWAPSDRVTLMLMPSWMRMEMTMVGVSASPAAGHHALALGETMAHSTSGIGDTRLGALVALRRNPKLSAHAGFVLSAPTGSVSRKDEDGNFVHYGMQPGSGTWDLQPSLTLRGAQPGFGWGIQASYLLRTGTHNASGFKFGDRLAATAWLSKPLSPRASLSARLAYSDEGIITGHYNSGHNHAAPADRQANYGGQRLEGGIGANFVMGENLRIGAEATLPLYQKVNGIQAPKRFGANLNISRMF
jgi:Putative MetA-pathway of phenol degradation